MSVDPSHPNAGKKTAPEPVYGTADLHQAELAQVYSSIGKMVQSINPTSPIWGFGQANRGDSRKMYFSKRLIKNQLLDKDPNSKVYYPQIDFRFQSRPKWSFGHADRGGDPRPAFAHYELADKSTNPLQAFKRLSREEPTIRFKSAQRVS